MQAFPMIIAMAIATYFTRIAGFAISARRVPKTLEVFLRYVPVAAFAALVASGLQSDPGAIEARVVGAIVAGLVMLRWKKLWFAMVTGMVFYWTVGYLI